MTFTYTDSPATKRVPRMFKVLSKYCQKTNVRMNGKQKTKHLDVLVFQFSFVVWQITPKPSCLKWQPFYYISQFCGLSGFNLEVLLLVLSLTGGCNKMGLELYEGRWDARMTGPLSLHRASRPLSVRSLLLCLLQWDNQILWFGGSVSLRHMCTRRKESEAASPLKA